MALSRLLLKKRVGQCLLLLGLTTLLLCLWTTRQEWEYHSSNIGASRHLHRHQNGARGAQEFVFVNSLLDEIRGFAEDDEENKDSQMNDQMLLNHNKEINDSQMNGQIIPDLDDYPDHQEKEPEVIYQLHNNDSLKACPLYPIETLVGRLAGLKNDVSPEELAKRYPDVEKGGRVRPKHCKAAEKVAVIIPFRQRQSHLYILLNNLIPLLRRQLIDARFFVIEQAMPTIFNRASLFNIGFLEAQKFDKYSCFIFHDVDLIPMNDRNLYRCDEHPMHFAVAMDKYNYELPYKKYFGGVVGFTRDQYLKINGNSNLYFGWGGEDDDLFERIDNKNYEIARPYMDVGRYDMVRHTHDSSNSDNCDRRVLLKSARERQDIEGLNTVKYKLKYVKVMSHMTWVNVYIDLKEVVNTAPKRLREELKTIHNRAEKNVCNFTRNSPVRD